MEKFITTRKHVLDQWINNRIGHLFVADRNFDGRLGVNPRLHLAELQSAILDLHIAAA